VNQLLALSEQVSRARLRKVPTRLSLNYAGFWTVRRKFCVRQSFWVKSAESKPMYSNHLSRQTYSSIGPNGSKSREPAGMLNRTIDAKNFARTYWTQQPEPFLRRHARY
jgi:hypothetical protein